MGLLGHGLCWLVGGQVVLARRSEATFGELLTVELIEGWWVEVCCWIGQQSGECRLQPP